MVVMAEMQQDEDLRYWLSNEDWYMSTYTRQWLERTPSAVAADVLAHIAEDAKPEPTDFFSVLAIFFASSGLATSTGIAGGGPKARKAGTRAALLLADMGDVRSVAPLVRVFTTGGMMQSKYQENIEKTLRHFLTRATEDPTLAVPVSDIEILADRIWQYGNGQKELTPAFTDLLLTALQFLHVRGEESSKTLLKTIAESPVKGPNRQKIQQAAQTLQGNDVP